jgi:hypothetical protein
MAVKHTIASVVDRLEWLLQDVNGYLDRHPDDDYERGYRNAIRQALQIIRQEA